MFFLGNIKWQEEKLFPAAGFVSAVSEISEILRLTGKERKSILQKEFPGNRLFGALQWNVFCGQNKKNNKELNQ